MHEKEKLLIIPSNFKTIKKINNNLLSNIKVTTFKEVKEELYFKYNEESIHFIMKKCGINYELARIYIENMYYIENKKYNISKLDNLVSLKQDLENNKLLVKNKLYKSFLKTKNIVIENYSNFTKFEQKIINELKEITNVDIIYPIEEKQIENCYQFNNIFDEVEYIFETISKLINEKVNINDVSIINVTDDYKNAIKLMSDFYSIPVDIQNDNYLYGTTTCKNFIKKYNETKSIEESLKYIENSTLYNEFVNICNKFVWCNDELLIKLLENEFKNTKILDKKYKDCIKINELNKYVFLLGFNNNYPITCHDDEYLSDEIKKILDLNVSYELNTINKKQIISTLKQIDNLMITYSLKSTTNEYYESNLVNELGIKTEKIEEFNSKYSNKLNKYNLIKYLDFYTKYGHINKNLNSLYNKYNIKYLDYNNKYTSIKKDDLNKYLNNSLLLSYTSLNDYYNCKFKYYLNDLLKININNDTLQLTIGNQFHYVLSHAFEENFDLYNCSNEYLNTLNKTFTYKEQFFIDKLIHNLNDIITTIKKQYKYTTLKDALYEKKIYVDKSNTMKITFMGIVDKILYEKSNDKTYAVIIDYKTGTPDTSLDKINYGINMQLPIYLYLINKEFKNTEVIGLYYQKLLHKKPNINDKEPLENLKLIGYTIDSEELISKIDSSYEDSTVIKGMKKGKNGFYAYTKLLNNKKINEMLELVEQKIDEAINSITNADFEINPKKSDKFSSCDKCIYNEICYRNEKDFVYLKEGEKNA